MAKDYAVKSNDYNAWTVLSDFNKNLKAYADSNSKVSESFINAVNPTKRLENAFKSLAEIYKKLGLTSDLSSKI